MSTDRREFLSAAFAAMLGPPGAPVPRKPPAVDVKALEAAASAPVLRLESLKQPIVIDSIELLRSGKRFLVRTRSRDGASGLAVTNEKARFLYPLLLQQVIPFFLGKDARELESLLDDVYVHESNYKMQGLAFWCCVAWVEMSLLDLLGKAAGRHVSDLFGGRLRERIPIYVASGNRDTTPEEEIAVLKRRIAETGAGAVKFKVGGRMSRNRDSLPQRSEALIELSRKALGDGIVIQADANGSYDAAHAIEIGKRLQAIGAYLFEEPCPFDDLDATRQVTQALTIPVSGGEQESSEHRFRHMIKEGVLRIVQPDLHYYGGFVRATRVARMAAVAELPITIHISGGNAGFAEMASFCSFTPNIGRFQELKEGIAETGPLFEPALTVTDGTLNVPTAPGLGLVHAEELLKGATAVVG
jgi:L-alanine-DL-glutamate epimerase-like enolase superfamily enzyme